jgi:hypothetical protein
MAVRWWILQGANWRKDAAYRTRRNRVRASFHWAEDRQRLEETLFLWGIVLADMVARHDEHHKMMWVVEERVSPSIVLRE